MKRIITLILVLAMAASLAIVIPVASAEVDPLAGSGSLVNQTATFTVTADQSTVALVGGEAYVTFTVSVQGTTTIPAFSFVLDPSSGMTLADKNVTQAAATEEQDFCYKVPAASAAVLNAYSQMDLTVTSGRYYFGAAGSSGGGVSTTNTAVLQIMAKFTTAGTYTLDLVKSGNDVVVAGASGLSNNQTNMFQRVVNSATVTVVDGYTVSGTVTRLVDSTPAAVSGATVVLKDSTGAQVGDSVTTDANGAYSFVVSTAGSYTVKVSYKDSSSRSCVGKLAVSVTNASIDEQNVISHLEGDTNRDGLIDGTDMQRIYSHINGSNVFADFFDGDVNEDGLIDGTDMQRIYSHINGSNLFN